MQRQWWQKNQGAQSRIRACISFGGCGLHDGLCMVPPTPRASFGAPVDVLRSHRLLSANSEVHLCLLVCACMPCIGEGGRQAEGLQLRRGEAE